MVPMSLVICVEMVLVLALFSWCITVEEQRGGGGVWWFLGSMTSWAQGLPFREYKALRFTNTVRINLRYVQINPKYSE